MVVPVVMVVLFGCANLAILTGVTIVETDTKSALAAEYGIWPYLPLRAVLPGIVKEIEADLGEKAAFPLKVASNWIDQDKNKAPARLPLTETALTQSPAFTPTSTATATPAAIGSEPETSTPIDPPSLTPTIEVSPTPVTATPTPSATWTDGPTLTATVQATFTPSATPTPAQDSTDTPTATPASDYTGFGQYGVFASNGVLTPQAGSITLWLKFETGAARNDHIIVHSEDSRWVFYVDTFHSSSLGVDILSLAARGGGNKIATNDAGTRSGYPEARLLVDNDGALAAAGVGDGQPWTGLAAYPEGQWHHIAMTWSGYPTGVVKISLDGSMIAEIDYDSRYDDDQPIFEMFSFGHKPYSWPNPANLPVYGDSGSGRLASGGIQVSGLRIYTRALSGGEISQLVNQGL